MSINEKHLTASELRKWKTLRESFGVELAEKYFNEWQNPTRPTNEPATFIQTGHVGHDSQAQSSAQNGRRKQDEEGARRRKLDQSRQPQAFVELALKIQRLEILYEAAKLMDATPGSLRCKFETLGARAGILDKFQRGDYWTRRPNKVVGPTHTDMFLGIAARPGSTTVGRDMKMEGHLLDNVSEHDPENVQFYLLECTEALETRLKTAMTARAKAITPGNPPDNSVFNEADLNQEPPFVFGHRMGAKSVITPSGIKVPGEVVSLDDLGGNTDQWVDLVLRRLILLNPDIPDPATDEAKGIWELEKARRAKAAETELQPYGIIER